MKARRWFLWTASGVLTVLLVLAFLKVSKLDFRLTLQQLRSVRWFSFALLVVLTGFHVYLSSLKWRCVDARLRREVDSVPPRVTSFALTSLGVALGQVLPVQLSMSVARTLGTYLHGRAVRRGTGGTLFEQTFDVTIVVFLAFASGLTLFLKGGEVLWIACAIVMGAFAMLAVGTVVRWIRGYVAALNARETAPTSRILRSVAALQDSGLLDANLGRQLMALSLARFTVQVVMAGQAAQAIGVHIPLWHLAAAMPFVILACVIVVTPAGLGVNELSYATTLQLFGTPLHVGAQWALANRFLVASSCFVVAAVATTVLALTKMMVSAGRTSVLQEE